MIYFRIFYGLWSIILELFADESDEEELHENEHMDDYDEDDVGEESDGIDESDEIDDEGNGDEEGESEISSEEDDENFLHTNGIKKINQHLGIVFLYIAYIDP